MYEKVVEFSFTPTNKIEGTPILKLAMVKRLKVNKNLQKKICQKFVKKFIKKSRQKKSVLRSFARPKGDSKLKNQ